METLVVEPFFEVACAVTGLELPALWEQKNPDHWEEFEKALIDEQSYCEHFFRDGRGIDRLTLRSALFDAYRWVDGMQELLAELAAAGWQMHTFSNYPIWFEMIEEKLELSRYLKWTFVSHKTGLRKPDLRAYAYASETLGVAPQDCLFVDDRDENIEAARAVGMDAIRFINTEALRQELSRRKVM
jgi:HAD superfamily hydrolase (TIGR01509 family)